MTGSKLMTFAKRAPILAALLTLILSAFAAAPALAQPQELAPEHLALARRYLELTDQSGLYELAVVQTGVNTYQQLLPQNPEIGPQLEEAIGVVIESYRGKKGELFDQFARIYALTFSEDELTQIVAFYESPVGIKLTKANVQLNPDIKRVMNLFEINLQTEFFRQVRAELKAKGIET